MVQYFPIVTGSLVVLGNVSISGSLNASGSIALSGSVASASYALSASNAATASFVVNAQTASFVDTAQTASFVQNAVSSSFASTSSFITLAQTASFVANAQSASNAVNAVTASSADSFLVRNTLTAQTIVVQTITSSVDFVTGSTRFGSIIDNTHQFTGSVSVSGSLTTSIAALGSAASLFLVSDGNVIKSRTAAQTLSDIAALPLAGGTLTGPLNGTSATFSGDLTIDTNTLYVDSTNNRVGIGTSTPSNPLHIQSNTVSQLNVTALSGNTNAQINLEPTGTGIALIGPANGVDLSFRTNAAIRMTLNGSTGAATFSSSVTAGDTILVPSDATGAGGYKINYYSPSASSRSWKIGNDLIAYGDFWIGQSTTQIGSTYTPRLYINESGSVGIGTSTPNLTTYGGRVLTISGVNMGVGYEAAIELQANITSNDRLGEIAFINSAASSDKRLAYIECQRIDNNNAGFLRFATKDGTTTAERMRITSDGYLRLASKGIQFNNDTADANSLDDYEEGTWTPIIGGTTSESGQSYSGQTGYYTKIGRQVTVTFRVVLTNKGTITGDVAIKGLPFTAANTISFGSSATYFEALATSWNVIFLMVSNSSSYATLDGTKTAVVSTVRATTSDIGNNTQFNGSFTYFV